MFRKDLLILSDLDSKYLILSRYLKFTHVSIWNISDFLKIRTKKIKLLSVVNSCIELSASMRKSDSVNDSNQLNGCENIISTECSFFKHLRTNENLRRSSTDHTITLEVFQPLAEPTIDEFRGSSVLEEMFRYHNTTLSSSAAIERIFPNALIILNPRRNRTSYC